MRLGTEARQRRCEPQTVPSGPAGNFPRSATTSVEHPEANNLVLRDLVRPFDP